MALVEITSSRKETPHADGGFVVRAELRWRLRRYWAAPLERWLRFEGYEWHQDSPSPGVDKAVWVSLESTSWKPGRG